MREKLSKLITQNAIEDPKSLVLSGDHGYALFDEILKVRKNQFLNVGVMEQAMVGISSGFAKVGFRPIVYGLSAFVPIRVLEQIKLDVCYPNLPVVFLGDGAGLVYSTLGSSHQCSEDIAALRPLPNIRIYTPSDEKELEVCFGEAISTKAPCYIRIGKSDREVVHEKKLISSDPVTLLKESSKIALISMGSMSSISQQVAKQLKLSHIVFPRIKPFPKSILGELILYGKLIIVEEHSRYGGLCSTILDAFAENNMPIPLTTSISLKPQFAKKCGSYQYALSEHQLDDKSLKIRILQEVENLKVNL